MLRPHTNAHTRAIRYYNAWRLIEEAEREVRGISQRVSMRKTTDPLDISEAEFKKRYRLTQEAFKFLCEELRNKTNLKSSKRITLELKVLCALSFFAAGSYQNDVSRANNLGQTTVSKYINEVTDALCSPSMANSFIKFPTTRAERDLIKEKFYNKYGIPGVCGCIDGSHFHIFTPNKAVEHLYYCRKHFHSLNVQIVCDSDFRILNVNPKYGGATHDAFIWDNSTVHTFMRDLHRNYEQVWLLADSGYPQRPWLMTPIPDAVDGSPEARYTSVHGKARVIIENTFGILKNRWRCLSKDRTLHYKPEKCAKIIMACCILHNILINFGTFEPDDYEMMDMDTEGSSSSSELVSANIHNDDLVRGRALRSLLVQRINRIHSF